MPLTCSHCMRVNSADARYCYYDGVSLVGAAGPAVAQKSFPSSFVFPSGQTCKDFDQFSLHCQREWEAAVEMLHKGYFQQFFSGMGRMDLGQAAQESANFPDRDRGLDQFLGRLPTNNVPAARLDVQPRQINLGTLAVGANSEIRLQLDNKGSRLIFGSITSSCDWLKATETGDAKHFQFRDRSSIVIHVKGQHLRAGNKPLEGILSIESNAGSIQVKVIASVPIKAFPEGCLAGAKSPRDVAEKAKKFPKEAGVLFENGAVAKWYQDNGWTYPVQGPASSGMAAVQQFFEALGLSKPPKVYITESKIRVRGAAGAKQMKQIQVRSDEARPVFAYAVSNVNWCVVKPAVLHGNLVTLPIEMTLPGESSQAIIRVTANGQQRFEVPIEATVDKSMAAAVVTAPIAIQDDTNPFAVSVATRRTKIRDAASESPSKDRFDPVKLAMHLAPLAILAFVTFGLFITDVFSDAPTRSQVVVSDDPPEGQRLALKDAEFKVEIQDEKDEGDDSAVVKHFKIEDEPEERVGGAPAPPVKVEIKDEPDEGVAMPDGKGAAIDPKLRIAYEYDASKKWGLVDALTKKRLTYAPNGGTNTTIFRVGGQSIPIGSGGSFNKAPDDPKREGKQRSIYAVSPRPGLKVTQILEIVPSKQPVDNGGKQQRLMDTLLVRYIYQNTGKTPINAGLRLEVDTMIGANDGVPFTVPGKGLIDTSADFVNATTVPDFVQALETGRVRDPGTIVHISLKLGGAIEAPSRVTLCHWNRNGDLSNIVAHNMGTDSAIIMVWPDQNLAPGKTREMGYAYGLGSVTATDPGGSLGMTVGGNFDIGQTFTITAYASNPVGGQTLTLELPAGLERVKGEQIQNVPAPTVGKTSIVSWEAKVKQTGDFKVKVVSSTGIAQAKTISIARGDAPVGGRLALDLKGAFEPGQEFTVIGKVNEPGAKQSLTLELPPGLQKVAGDDTQAVPAPPAGSKDAEVQWRVRVIEPGKYRVRVLSNTGIAQAKTITIVQPTRAEGLFQIQLNGDFAPGKTFTVATRVATPALDQKLTLILPPGLQRVDGMETVVPEPGAPIVWQVKIDQPGKFTVGVKSTTGVTQRKTLVIEPPGDNPGRFDFKLVGDIRPGKEFQVTAQVTNPIAGQTLKLVLPKGLELAKGDVLQFVPAGKSVSVTWNVRVLEGGRLPVRIQSSTGLARTKTITLSESKGTLYGG